MVNRVPAEDEGNGINISNRAAKTVVVLACTVEVGVGVGIAAILSHFFILSLAGWDFFGSGEDPVYPIWEQGALVALAVLAVLAGALPAMLRVGITVDLLIPLGVSMLWCVGAGLIYLPLLFVVLTLASVIAEDVENGAAFVLLLGITFYLPALPLTVVPILVNRWS